MGIFINKSHLLSDNIKLNGDKFMANYIYNCHIHGEVNLDLKLGTAKEIEKCPDCESDCKRVFTVIGNVWKVSGAYGKISK